MEILKFIWIFYLKFIMSSFLVLKQTVFTYIFNTETDIFTVNLVFHKHTFISNWLHVNFDDISCFLPECRNEKLLLYILTYISLLIRKNNDKKQNKKKKKKKKKKNFKYFEKVKLRNTSLPFIILCQLMLKQCSRFHTRRRPNVCQQ